MSFERILAFFGEILKNPTEKPLFRFEIAMAAIVALALVAASSKDILRLILQAISKVRPNFEFEHVLVIGLIGLGISFGGLLLLELIWKKD